MNLDRSEVYFIDIGANLGTFTLGVAAAGFKVIAIEAMSVNQVALSMSLCSNIGMSEAVTLLSVALGRGAEQCTVFSASQNVLDGTIRCGEAGETELLQLG
jgi:FkbM family methyltransferase